jgi:hypothetical protein
MVSKTIIDKEKDTDAAVTNAAATGGNSWDHTTIHDAIPWPGETFVIVEKASGCCQHDKHKRMMNWCRSKWRGVIVLPADVVRIEGFVSFCQWSFTYY